MMDPAARLAWTVCCAQMRLYLPVGSYSRRVLFWPAAQDRAYKAFMAARRRGDDLPACSAVAFWTAQEFLNDPNGDAST